MQMRHNVTVFAECVEQSLRHISRLQRTKANPCEIRNFSQFIKELGQFVVLRVGPVFSPDGILAISTKKYACYDDFPVSSFNKGLCLLQNFFKGFTSGKGTGYWKDTIAAKSVTAI